MTDLKNKVTLRKTLYFTLFNLRGFRVGRHYNRLLKEYRECNPQDVVRSRLIRLLDHAGKNVPYYSKVMEELGDGYREDPFQYLKKFPILTRDIARSRFEELQSADRDQRKWINNTSGGSSGEPVRLVQDNEFLSISRAITLLFSRLIGKELGDREIYLWGSERDVLEGSEKWTARLVNGLINAGFVNAFHMTPETMRGFVDLLNRNRPELIIAYAESMFEVASFIERNGIAIVPQKAIITSAGTLYPSMREKISEVFQCPVYNQYGSREVGAIACELPGHKGLWVAPWGNYLEIVDGQQQNSPDGVDGEIIVTSLNNYAMPLIRYQIGDCGALDPQENQVVGLQHLKNLRGRTNGIFKMKDGALVDAQFFEFLVYFKYWIEKFQVIQTGYSSIVFKFISHSFEDHTRDLEEIKRLTRVVMGSDCQVDFQFVDEIPPLSSGKFQYLICQI